MLFLAAAGLKAEGVLDKLLEWIKKKELRQSESIYGNRLTLTEMFAKSQTKHHARLIIYILIFVLAILVLLNVFPYPVALAMAVVLILISEKSIFLKVNYMLFFMLAAVELLIGFIAGWII